MNKKLEEIKIIVNNFNLQDREWKTESVTIKSDGKSHSFTNPFADRVEFKMKEGKLYVTEIFKNVSHYNGEEIVTYYEDKCNCIDDLFENGINVRFAISNRIDRPAEIYIDYEDKNYKTFMMWNIVEKV